MIHLNKQRDVARKWDTYQSHEWNYDERVTYRTILTRHFKESITTEIEVFKRDNLASDSVKVNIDDFATHDGCYVAVWFKKGKGGKRARVEEHHPSAVASIDIKPEGSVGADILSANNTTTIPPTVVSNHLNPDKFNTFETLTPALPNGRQMIKDYFDVSPLVENLLADYLGTSGNEGNVMGHVVKGDVPRRFLSEGFARSGAVGRVVLDNNGGTGTCTVFSGVKNNIFAVLTNNHIISTEVAAKYAQVELDDDDWASDRQHIIKLNPELLFLTNVTLDYTLVAVQHDYDTVQLLMHRFCPKLNQISEGVRRFEAVNIVSFPGGGPMRASIRGSNYLTDKDGNLLFGDLSTLITHGAYTQAGSSGAMLFDDRWLPFALHKGSGEPAAYKQQPVKVDHNQSSGYSIYTEGVDREEDQLFKYNRAINMRDIVRDIVKQGGEAARNFVPEETD